MSSPYKFNVISTFSGCGGSSLGYQLAGGKVRLAVEYDKHAVEVYKLNFPETPVYFGDINKLTVKQCLEMAGMKKGEVDILDGSPPCQGFSTAGARDYTDDRNQLFQQFTRLIKGVQPKVFVMENVSGMVKGPMKLIFAECLKQLKACGYQVKARLLNAQYFNTPQKRQRLIFIGCRNDLGIEPSHPKAQTKPVLVREALRDCPEWLIEFPKPGTQGEQLAAGMRQGQKSSEYFRKGAGFGQIRISWDKPSPTITCSGTFFHPTLPRRLSGAEMKRIGTFPDDFKFTGSCGKVQRRIGNSVPPNFMRAIAEHIYQEILLKIN